MREITKTISIPVDGKPRDFRLTKLDAFSGASLLRLMASMEAAPACHPERPEAVPPCHPERSEGSYQQSPVFSLLSSLSDADLRSLMTVCLKLTLEEALRTREGFFEEGDSRPPPVAAA